MTSQLSTAASEASAAKSSATSALEAANKAAEAAKSAGDAAAQATADAAVAKATADAAAADAKAEAIAAAKAEVEALAKKIDALPKGLSDEDIAKLKAEVDKATAKVTAILGHRLQSLAVIPTTHVNGIAAITLTTLQYTPQEYAKGVAPHEGLQEGHEARPVLDHKSVAKAKPLYISSEKNEAFYHVSPNNGVRTQDIKLPIFESILSQNVTRADATVKENNPIAPTAWEINNNILKVTYKKTTNGLIGYDGEPHNGVPTSKKETDKEYFTMVSLKAPIADENLQADEINGAYVNSEYVRVEELIKVPYIAHNKADFTKVIDGNMFADETQKTTDPEVGTDGKLYVHYHDSICIYDSQVNQYVDILAPYNQELDLKKWVTVCLTDPTEDAVFNPDHKNHEKLANYADYGLGFRFYVAKAAYNTLGGEDENSNKTNQQEFAEIKDAKAGLMTSKVYTLNGDPNQTSVGREPIVRAELWDEVNGKLIAIRYIKVKWVKQIGTVDIPYEFPKALYACGAFQSLIGTQEMNEVFYAKAQEGGMTKATFHSTWTDPKADENGKLIFTEGSKDYGTVELLRNNEGSVESYNILWTISHLDIVNKIVKDYKGSWEVWKASGKPLEFTKTFYWKSNTANTLKITFTRKIYQEEFKLWGYDGRYWRNGSNYEVFNVNPIVYDTKEANPAWGKNETNNPTSNIYTDLLNGFLDDMGKKPTTGADGALYFETPDKMRNDKVVFGEKNAIKSISSFIYEAGKKYYYAADYQQAETGFRGVDRNKNDYAAFFKEGVRFTYDESKLNDANHTYYYYDAASKTMKKGYAAVKDNDTMEPKLYILPSKTTAISDKYLAATIVNYKENNLNKDEYTYNIKLQESDPEQKPYDEVDGPTEAAKALVGAYVPIKLVANLCNDNDPAAAAQAHVVLIKAYDAYIIEPLQPNKIETDNFLDAKIGGSTISVKDANVYLSWNAETAGKTDYYKVREAKDHNAPKGLIEELGNFYEVEDAVWPTKEEMPKVIKTNLRLVDGNLVPVDVKDWPANELVNGIPQGALPSNTEVVYNNEEESLTYHNYSGTPVNWDYDIYIPVTYGYKWKTQVNWVKVHVSSNTGTNDTTKN